MGALSPEKWNALSPHLDSVLDLDPSARESYLDSLSASDPALASALRELLSGQDRLSGFLEGSALQPEFVGPYRVTTTLGEGGMGVVYLAEQDEPVRRKLAVKVIRTLGGRDLIARFDSERQALALMEHPHIARLYDAGVTREGNPFFAMEYVEGAPLTTYCDARKMGVRDRLRLFVSVCGAVQHAHQKGVIHRDLKPSNILVAESDGLPDPKVIDFGVAKALRAPLTDRSPHTEAGVRLGTPRYMSPEQERGAEVDTRTDIYSLGVLLFELLTGMTPRDSTAPDDEGATSPWSAFRRASHRNRDAAANRGDTVQGLSRRLRGDLDWIARKALDVKPADRYASASELAEDVERYLNDEVVLARNSGWWLSLRKFGRRHRVAAAAMLIGFAATAVTAVVALRERTLAQQRAVDIRRLASSLIFDLHDEILTLPGATKAREKVAAISTGYLRKLEVGADADPHLAFDLAVAYSRLSAVHGSTQGSGGDSAAAVDDGGKAIRFGRIAEAKRDLDDTRIRQLFRSYVTVADVFRTVGKAAESGVAVDRLLALAPRVAPSGRRSAEALSSRMAGLHYDRFDSPERALPELRKSLELYRAENDSTQRMATALSMLARTEARVGDLDGALAHFREGLPIDGKLVAAQPSNTFFVRSSYLTRIHIADLLGAPDRLNLARPAEAAAYYREALRIAEASMEKDSNDEMAKLDVARALGKLGSLIATSKPAEALALMDRAAELTNATSSGNSSAVEMRLAYLTESVTPLARMGRVEQAKRHTNEARRLGKAGDDLEIQVSRKEAEWQYAGGLREDALRSGLKVRDLILSSLRKTETGARPESLVAADYQWVPAVEAVAGYASGFDQTVCREAVDELALYWERMAAKHPDRAFLKDRAKEARARARTPAFCSR